MASPSAAIRSRQARQSGLVRIIVDFAACDRGHLRVDEADKAAKNARLGLPAQPEQNEMVARENRVDDLRNHRVVVSVHAGKQRLALFHFCSRFSRNSCRTVRFANLLFRPCAVSKLAKIFWLWTHAVTGPFCGVGDRSNRTPQLHYSGTQRRVPNWIGKRLRKLLAMRQITVMAVAKALGRL